MTCEALKLCVPLADERCDAPSPAGCLHLGHRMPNKAWEPAGCYRLSGLQSRLNSGCHGPCLMLGKEESVENMRSLSCEITRVTVVACIDLLSSSLGSDCDLVQFIIEGVAGHSPAH